MKKVTPRVVITFLRNRIEFRQWDIENFKKSNPFIKEPDRYICKDSSIKVGIMYNTWQYHKHWIAACRDLNVSYQIIYLERSDWISQVNKSGCDLYVVWPDIKTQETKLMFDERLRIMEEEMHKKLYPSLKEIWLYENKRVQHYWLKHHGFRTPLTYVFYDEDEAINYLRKADYPLVMKSNHGASASGVFIIENVREAIKKTKKFLRKGYAPKRNAAGKLQKGSVFIQEYIANSKEWRMVRIGNSYFGHGKDMSGQFHSGSGKANWKLPPVEAFTLLKEITERGGFTSMDVDLFEDQSGNFYVNELQTVFGNSVAKEQMKINGIPGRYILDSKGKLLFEEGSFCNNHLCNLRLDYLLNKL
jgi:hypothetical protein